MYNKHCIRKFNTEWKVPITKLCGWQCQQTINKLTAIAIAISASVTVSMGDETRGAFSVMFFVSCADSFTSSAVKSMYPGRRMKSLEGEKEEDIKWQKWK